MLPPAGRPLPDDRESPEAVGVVASEAAAGPVVSVSFDATKSSIHARWASEKEGVSEGVGSGSAITRERGFFVLPVVDRLDAAPPAWFWSSSEATLKWEALSLHWILSTACYC